MCKNNALYLCLCCLENSGFLGHFLAVFYKVIKIPEKYLFKPEIDRCSKSAPANLILFLFCIAKL